jgi:hypothetical protein
MFQIGCGCLIGVTNEELEEEDEDLAVAISVRFNGLWTDRYLHHSSFGAWGVENHGKRMERAPQAPASVNIRASDFGCVES